MSDDILDEVCEVLSRPKIRQKILGLTDERLHALMVRFSEKATCVRVVPQHFHLERDPKDEKYLNLAIEVGAEYLVSRDHHLLDLMKGESEESQEFRKQYETLVILEPVAFLAMHKR